MDQIQKAEHFAALHKQGSPLFLYNAWDTGSAIAILSAGSKAIATSSWSIADAHGYRDGEDIPIALVEQIVGRIAASIDAPVSVDFEGGYTEDDELLAENASRLMDLGAIGINFEDRIVKGRGLYDIDRQASRIATIRDAAINKGIPLFINARTDLFLCQGYDPERILPEVLDRAQVYAEAGASGFFVPGLANEKLIGTICERSPLPVNVMLTGRTPTIKALAQIGVSRISYGPMPYLGAMKLLQHEAAAHRLSDSC